MIERASIAALQVQFASAYVLNAEGKPGVKVDVSQAKGINPADIKPLNPGDAERMAASRVAAKGLVPDNVARWGYRAQLMAQGGQPASTAFTPTCSPI